MIIWKKVQEDKPVFELMKDRDIKDKVIICMVGLPRSGKTSWIKNHHTIFGNCPVVELDALRIAIHGQRFIKETEVLIAPMAKVFVKVLLLNPYHDIVIIDATSRSRWYRDYWKNIGCKVYFKHIETSAEECISRAQKDGDDYIIPVIEYMNKEFQPLEEDEIPVEKYIMGLEIYKELGEGKYTNGVF